MANSAANSAPSHRQISEATHRMARIMGASFEPRNQAPSQQSKTHAA